MELGMWPRIFFILGFISASGLLIFVVFFRHSVGNIAASWIRYGGMSLTVVLTCTAVIWRRIEAVQGGPRWAVCSGCFNDAVSGLCVDSAQPYAGEII